MTTYTYRARPRRAACTCGRPHLKPGRSRVRVAALNESAVVQAVVSNV